MSEQKFQDEAQPLPSWWSALWESLTRERGWIVCLSDALILMPAVALTIYSSRATGHDWSAAAVGFCLGAIWSHAEKAIKTMRPNAGGWPLTRWACGLVERTFAPLVVVDFTEAAHRHGLVMAPEDVAGMIRAAKADPTYQPPDGVTVTVVRSLPVRLARDAVASVKRTLTCLDPRRHARYRRRLARLRAWAAITEEPAHDDMVMEAAYEVGRQRWRRAHNLLARAEQARRTWETEA